MVNQKALEIANNPTVVKVVDILLFLMFLSSNLAFWYLQNPTHFADTAYYEETTSGFIFQNYHFSIMAMITFMMFAQIQHLRNEKISYAVFKHNYVLVKTFLTFLSALVWMFVLVVDIPPFLKDTSNNKALINLLNNTVTISVGFLYLIRTGDLMASLESIHHAIWVFIFYLVAIVYFVYQGLVLSSSEWIFLTTTVYLAPTLMKNNQKVFRWLKKI